MDSSPPFHLYGLEELVVCGQEIVIAVVDVFRLSYSQENGALIVLLSSLGITKNICKSSKK